MRKVFYGHLIKIESVLMELETLDLTDKEKMHLAQLIDSNLHSTVLDAILSELDEDDKKIFLEHLNKHKHDEIWKLLNSKVDKIEDKIKKAADELTDELHKDIKEAKKNKEKNK